VNFLDRIANGLLKIVATGRVARKGALFRVRPNLPDTLFLRPVPGAAGDKSRCFRISKTSTATFLVLKVQEDKPLWEQWVKVLFCQLNAAKFDDTMVGWLPYHEFNRFVLAQWETWEEERTP
jgi:hypothetical protein